MPYCTTAVSPRITRMSSRPTPSSSAAICANVVSSPCPCGQAPVMMVTLPLGSIFTVALSQPPAGVGLLLAEFHVADEVERFLEWRGVIAAVIRKPRSRRVREVLFRDEILE